jgi:serine/threonine protein kinase
VNENGVVKIADFGLAKFCPKNEGIRKTPTVVTLSYRAPEVLLTRG